MKKIIVSTVLFFILLGNSCIGVSQSKWNSYPLKEMEIIYPENEALSNPPFIHWQAVKDAVGYQIVLEKDDKIILDRTTRNNFYTPAAPLSPGDYSVTISLVGKDSSTLNRSKKFHISETNRPYTQDLNNITFKKGMPLLFKLETINKIKSDNKSDYYKRFLEFARQPEDEELKSFSEPVQYKEGKWDLNTWKNNNTLCFKIQKRALSQIMAYKITGEKVFLDNTMKLVHNIVDWDPAGATGVWENDHSAHALLYTLSIAYNALENDISENEKVKMIKAIKLRSENMYEFLNPFIRKETSAGLMNDPENNHPWFCTSALGYGGLALMGVVPEAQEWTEFAAQMFNGMYLPRGGSSGGWHEGIDYWSYNLYFVFHFCDALKNSSGVNLYKHPWLKNTDFFQIYCHPPVGGYVPFGDCKNQLPTGFDKVVMMRPASEYNDPIAWKYIDTVPAEINDLYLFYALLWGNRNSVNTDSDLKEPFAYHFKDIGWAVSNNSIFNKEKQILFAMRSGKYFGKGDNHSHADQNHFIITAGGDKLIWDAGYYKHYMDNHHKNYSMLSIAHNTILVDGEGQLPHKPGADGKITKFELDHKSLLVQGDASNPEIYDGKVKKFIRTIKYKDEKNFYVQDKIILNEPGRISYLLHSVFPIEYNSEDKSIHIKGEHYQLKGKFKSDVEVENFLTDKFSVPAEKGLPEQYHLELKTIQKIKKWYPEFNFTVTPVKPI